MISKVYFLIVFFIMSCQTVPSAGVPKADDTPIQLFKTSLEITVRDNLGNIVDGAEVMLFNNKEDYQEEANPIQGIKYTDSKGRVKYSELNTQEYYINVAKGDLNNYGAGIKTDQLTEKRNNKVTIIIE
ncbi:carboxypeptidase regulatory-like domain-containing protein [Catalinimonas niigatensis]|uniref:carboxypeptidase regulatory-like domain-containing protein n=1 Tax=Catalinimonas niigatensis TaxID=1397264 RepID=UPI00266589B3|nr:carboxypeptidase regulatory-like domain-containing protein [Catalinimonas niigatensis]WPP48538.1 carboxypeptidase regulatory-like domain-containing protein [Catalinimonas niigatensis]